MHKLFYIGGEIRKDLPDLSCWTCYLTKDIIKHERFDQFWGLVKQLDMSVKGYLKQTIYAFNKLTKLSFEKEKPYNASLVVEIKAILIIIEYSENSRVDIPMATYQIGIMLKKSKLLTTEHTDQQLLEEVASTNKDWEAKKWSLSPMQSFSNMLKRKNSVASDTSSLVAVDISIRKSRS